MNVAQLKNIAVLREMDDGALASLASVLEEREFADAQPVFGEGDPGDSMYFILAGCIRIEKHARATGAATTTLALLEQGDYFGEMALLDQKPRSASAVAAGPTRLIRLTKAAFDEIQRRSSSASMSVLFAMIRTSSERIRRLSAHVVAYDEVGKAIGEARDLQALLDVILHQLAFASEADWGLLLLHSQFSDRLEVRSQFNVALTAQQSEAVATGQGFVGAVLGNPQDQIIASFNEQEPFKSCARLGFETASLLLSPISLEGHLLGLVVLGGQQREHFDLNALNLTKGVARQAAQAIMNARYREEQQSRVRHSQQFVRF